MKKARKLSEAAVLQRVRLWKDRLNLNDYKVGVAFGPDEDTEDDADADCTAMPEYLSATIRFNLAAIPPDEIDHFIVHELLHMPVWRLANFARTMCGKDAVKLETLREHEELLVTYMERVVVRLAAGQ
jgi:hypothetical protein